MYNFSKIRFMPVNTYDDLKTIISPKTVGMDFEFVPFKPPEIIFPNTIYDEEFFKKNAGAPIAIGLSFSDKRDDFGKYNQESYRFNDALLRKDLSGLTHIDYDDLTKRFNELAEYFFTDYICFGRNDAICLDTALSKSSVPLHTVVNVYDIAPVLSSTQTVFIKTDSIGLFQVAEIAEINTSHYASHRPGDDASLLLEVATKLVKEGEVYFQDFKNKVFLERHSMSVEAYEENKVQYLFMDMYQRVERLENMLKEQKKILNKIASQLEGKSEPQKAQQTKQTKQIKEPPKTKQTATQHKEKPKTEPKKAIIAAKQANPSSIKPPKPKSSSPVDRLRQELLKHSSLPSADSGAILPPIKCSPVPTVPAVPAASTIPAVTNIDPIDPNVKKVTVQTHCCFIQDGSEPSQPFLVDLICKNFHYRFMVKNVPYTRQQKKLHIITDDMVAKAKDYKEIADLLTSFVDLSQNEKLSFSFPKSGNSGQERKSFLVLLAKCEKWMDTSILLN